MDKMPIDRRLDLRFGLNSNFVRTANFQTPPSPQQHKRCLSQPRNGSSHHGGRRKGAIIYQPSKRQRIGFTRKPDTRNREPRCVKGTLSPYLLNAAEHQDQNDAIDLTDNDIRLLTNLPRLRRLRTLFLGRNRIESIAPTIASSCPNLTTLVLTSNSISELGDLEPLRECKKLTFLSLLDNPVTRKDNYRLYVIFIMPQLRFLDFRRVKDAVCDQSLTS